MCFADFLFDIASGNYQNNVASSPATQIKQLCVLHKHADIHAAVDSFVHNNAIP